MCTLPDWANKSIRAVWRESYDIIIRFDEFAFPTSNLPQWDLLFLWDIPSIYSYNFFGVNGADMVQKQTAAPRSGLLIDINICVCLQGVVNCIFCAFTLHHLSCCPCPSQLIKHCCSFPSAFWASSYFALYLFLSYRGCFGSGAILSSKRWPVEGGVRVGDLVYMCVCVYTIMLLCVSSQIKCQQKQLWNLKWQNFSPFHSLMFGLGHSAAFHSCEVNRFLTKSQEWGSRELKSWPIGYDLI